MKAQTALEYLMTYGWAILIVVIVIGALYALGLTKPCKWTGTQVREFSDFTVANPKYTAAGGFAFDVSRMKSDLVYVTPILAAKSPGGVSQSETTNRSMSSSIAPVRVSLTNLGTVATGDCYTVDVTLTYQVTTAGGAVMYNSTGRISGVVDAT